MKISKGTIVRLISVLFVIVNLILKAVGKPVIDIDEGSILAVVEAVITIAVVAVAFWKNNSFSPAAIKADEFLKKLKGEEKAESEGVE